MIAREFIHEAAAQEQQIAVSSISLAEILYLVEKGRVPLDAYAGLTAFLNLPRAVFWEAPVCQLIVNHMHRVARKDVPDLPDRIIAATSLHFGVPVISRDGRIRASSVQSLW